MVPTASDHTAGRGPEDRRPEEFSVERRTIQGGEVLVRRLPDEVYVERRANRPAYYRVRVGDRIKDAGSDVSSPRIEEWDVVEITPERVVGVSRRSGERREFDRESLERGLVVGNLATTLTDFARVAVHPVGDWTQFDPAADPGARVYRGRPYLTVLVYGDNGQRYGLRYRYVEAGNDTDVAVWEEDVAVSGLDETVRRRLFERVDDALVADGFVVVDD